MKLCLYCHGNTTDDTRGNCAACGAPRNCLSREEQKFTIEYYAKAMLEFRLNRGLVKQSLIKYKELLS
jgi:hypothetical protein